MLLKENIMNGLETNTQFRVKFCFDPKAIEIKKTRIFKQMAKHARKSGFSENSLINLLSNVSNLGFKTKIVF